MSALPGTALITGGTGGLGVAVVERFLEQGDRVIVPYIEERELERVPDAEGLDLVEADLFDAESVRAVVDHAAADEEAPLSAVVNLVGGYDTPGRVHEASVDDFERMLRLNLRATYLVCQTALPRLLRTGSGAIVCVGSRAGERPFAGAAGYAVSKAAVVAFVKALDVEYRGDGIRANAVLPSVIDTPANRAAQPDADHSRWVTPGKIAEAIAFLCSDAAGAISGAAIPVYGQA
jgi:NAD(P)-dependent dehydrogenase (short-subunit alcohol dehydrogenase family)